MLLVSESVAHCPVKSSPLLMALVKLVLYSFKFTRSIVYGARKVNGRLAQSEKDVFRGGSPSCGGHKRLALGKAFATEELQVEAGASLRRLLHF